MGAKNYKHIAIENQIANSFDEIKNRLRKYKQKPTDTETMRILLAKNKQTTLTDDVIIKILLNPEDE